MRLSLSSVVILSLFAASSHAFAPPASIRRSITSASRLQAGNELSGLLSEYSSTSTGATAAVEKVADVVSTTVATPPTPPPSAADVVESGMDSLMKAASAAQDAADQAAAAAAAVAAKSAAASKAAAATKAAAAAKAAAGGLTIAGGIQIKPLVGGVYVPRNLADGTKLPFQVDPSKVDTNNAFDAQVRAKENLALMKANFMSAFPDGAGSALKGTSSSSVDVNMPNFDSASLAPAIADIVASLHLKEYGGWYAAAFMAIVAAQQRTAGKEDASELFDLELASAREKANEAATAAGLAAEGARTAKKLAMKMDKDMKMDGGQALLESSRSKMAQVEKVIVETEKRALQAEVISLRNQLEIVEGGKKKKTTKKKTKLTEIEEAYPTKMVVDAGSDEDGRIIEILKEIDEENKVKQAAELERRREEEAKFVKAEKAKAAKEAKTKAASKKMTKGVEAAQKKAETAINKKAATKKTAKKTTTKAKRKSAPKASTEKAATKPVAKAVTKAAPKKAAVKAAPEATPKETVAKAVTKEAPKAAPKEAAAKAAPKATPKETVAKAVTKEAPKAAPKEAPKARTVTATADDWATLAESTLKRKTVAQLTEYLSGKGVSVADDSGKAPKKAELLAVVKSL